MTWAPSSFDGSHTAVEDAFGMEDRAPCDACAPPRGSRVEARRELFELTHALFDTVALLSGPREAREAREARVAREAREARVAREAREAHSEAARAFFCPFFSHFFFGFLPPFPPSWACYITGPLKGGGTRAT